MLAEEKKHNQHTPILHYFEIIGRLQVFGTALDPFGIDTTPEIQDNIL
ncbi:MAG: hypothetical protein PHG35_08705 [Dehalococcoidales bacterium]|nr:hypothetical protein [Dehalococcoidales bacterium]